MGLFSCWAAVVPAQAQPLRPDAIAQAVLPDAPDPSSAQVAEAAQGENGDDLSLRNTPQRLLRDEWQIVKSPARTSRRDLRWLLPLAGAAAATIATDSRAMRDVVSSDTGFNNANNTTSGVLRDAFIGVPVLLFGAGEWRKQDEARDTGLLAGEAMINAYATGEAIKYVTWRERPLLDHGRGHFFTSAAASDPSFVSGHSLVAWSSAAVLANEYTAPWQQIGIYTAASAVSVTRVLAQQHFPSDVLLGSAAGWLIGRYICQAHKRGPGVQLHSALRAIQGRGLSEEMDTR